MMLFRRVLTYRLTFYYLSAVLLAALVLSILGIVRLPWMDLVFSTAVTLTVCWGVNWAFARVHGAGSHWESVCISALIVAMLVTPVAPGDFAGTGFLVLASAWAMASKYLVAIDKRHLFNPAAFGAALMSLAFHRPVSWWVGDYAILLPLLVLGGVLIVARLRYFEMLGSFAVVALGLAVANGGLASFADMAQSLSRMGIHSMFCFFGLVMLTEPRTAPLGRWRQVAYGGLVGLLFSPFTHIGSYYFTPEAALLCGNLFTFFSNKRRIRRWFSAFA